MNTFNILVVMIAMISMIEANDAQEDTVLIPEMPAGVWDDGKCTIRRMQNIYQECEKALGTNATDANRLACNLLKPNAVPLGGLSNQAVSVWSVGMFENDDIGYSMFDICIIPRLINEGSIRIVKVADSEHLRAVTDSSGVGRAYGEAHEFEDSDIISTDDMYSYLRKRSIPEKIQSMNPGSFYHQYLYRDYKLIIDSSALSRSLSASIITTLNSILSEVRQYKWNTKKLMQDLSYQALIDGFLFAPTEFYMDQGVGSIVHVVTEGSFYKNWPSVNATAEQVANSSTWDYPTVVVSANDFLYGGCTLDAVSSQMTIHDAIDACHASSTLQPFELQATSLARFINVFDLLKDTAPAKAFPQEFKLLTDSLYYAFTDCRCDSGYGPNLVNCFTPDKKYYHQISTVQKCESDFALQWLRNIDYVEPLPF